MKFSKEQKERLRTNPNVKEVYQATIHYTEDFKEKALYEFEMGKHIQKIFLMMQFCSVQSLDAPILACKNLVTQ